MADNEKTCFIIMPITTPDTFLDKYRDGTEHFRHVLKCLLVPSVEAAGFKAISPIAKGSDLIQAEIIRNIEQSDLVLCDMSCLNPNVFFEFGIRTSLNKPVCVVKDELTKKVPFDTGILNYQDYRGTLEPWELPEEIRKLAEHIKTAEGRCKGENMLWEYFGLRTEAKPYAGETGTDAKIDYLTMQMDSLRGQIGNILQRTERHALLRERPEMMWNNKKVLDEIFSEIVKSLPEGIEDIEFTSGPCGEVVMYYRGPLRPKEQILLRRNIRKLYGIELSFSKRRSGETEDSQKVYEDDA